tara:strand:- start:951 stop:1115 length:165 start_codon:yes stop_codon:yes gene_type:complete
MDNEFEPGPWLIYSTNKVCFEVPFEIAKELHKESMFYVLVELVELKRLLKLYGL